MDKQALRERYQEHAVGMSNHMREAGEHIAANAQLDLTPEQLVQEISLIVITLKEAQYHAERMAVYARLMDSKVKDTQHT